MRQFMGIPLHSFVQRCQLVWRTSSKTMGCIRTAFNLTNVNKRLQEADGSKRSAAEDSSVLRCDVSLNQYFRCSKATKFLLNAGNCLPKDTV